MTIVALAPLPIWAAMRPPTALMGVRSSPSGLQMEVHDTGVGMSEAEFTQALGPNERLDKTLDMADGHGRGLGH